MTGPNIELRILWGAFLEAALREIRPHIKLEEQMKTDVATWFHAAQGAIAKCRNMPKCEPVPNELFSCWAYFAGERIAKLEEYTMPRHADALRYYAFDKKNMDFDKAMALSDSKLAAMFGDRLNCVWKDAPILKTVNS